ncbi:MAG: hypothetical protein WD049_01960, partial [Candidatus Paceibacterota bacterium]
KIAFYVVKYGTVGQRALLVGPLLVVLAGVVGWFVRRRMRDDEKLAASGEWRVAEIVDLGKRFRMREKAGFLAFFFCGEWNSFRCREGQVGGGEMGSGNGGSTCGRGVRPVEGARRKAAGSVRLRRQWIVAYAAGGEMPQTHAKIEDRYRELLASLTPAQRVARSAAMFVWTREQIARQIRLERGALDHETIKWLVALRLYGKDPIVRTLIEGQLQDVPR